MKKAIKIIAVVVGCIIVAILIVVAIYYFSLKARVVNVQKVDDNGSLYYAEYNGNYDDFIVNSLPQIVSKFGCSAFYAKTSTNQPTASDLYLTARNFDYFHKSDNDEPNVTNMLLKLTPEGKYKSLNMIDLSLFDAVRLKYTQGCLDNYSLLYVPLGFLPIACVDGINEKGLVCSTLEVPIDNENPSNQDDPNKETQIISQILRGILDNCESCNEAISYVSSVNYCQVLDANYHLMVTDVNGNSYVFEWRYGQFSATKTDICTNFYTNSDDADSYYDEYVQEEYKQPNSKYKQYRYGDGFGYERFNTIVESLDATRTNDSLATVSKQQAMNILQKASLAPVPGTTLMFTLYSIVYDNNNKSCQICVSRDYSNVYEFKL